MYPTFYLAIKFAVCIWERLRFIMAILVIFKSGDTKLVSLLPKNEFWLPTSDFETPNSKTFRDKKIWGRLFTKSKIFIWYLSYESCLKKVYFVSICQIGSPSFHLKRYQRILRNFSFLGKYHFVPPN